MSDLLNNLCMLGHTNSKEMPVSPEWFIAENMHQCDAFYQMMYAKKRKTSWKKKDILSMIQRKKQQRSKEDQILVD